MDGHQEDSYHNMAVCLLSSLPQGLFSSVICPGLVMTNLTYGILPSFLWSLIMPIMYLVRRQTWLSSVRLL